MLRAPGCYLRNTPTYAKCRAPEDAGVCEPQCEVLRLHGTPQPICDPPCEVRCLHGTPQSICDPPCEVRCLHGTPHPVCTRCVSLHAGVCGMHVRPCWLKWSVCLTLPEHVPQPTRAYASTYQSICLTLPEHMPQPTRAYASTYQNVCLTLRGPGALRAVQARSKTPMRPCQTA
eukprot:359138-Chlamydomonas_euryale.AAC.2